MTAIVLAVNKKRGFSSILVNLTDRRTNKQFDFQLKHKNCTPHEPQVTGLYCLLTSISGNGVKCFDYTHIFILINFL